MLSDFPHKVQLRCTLDPNLDSYASTDGVVSLSISGMIDGISTIIDVNLVRGPDYKPHKHRSESSSDKKLN